MGYGEGEVGQDGSKSPTGSDVWGLMRTPTTESVMLSGDWRPDVNLAGAGRERWKEGPGWDGVGGRSSDRPNTTGGDQTATGDAGSLPRSLPSTCSPAFRSRGGG
jgi:hypothetical protein